MIKNDERCEDHRSLISASSSSLENIWNNLSGVTVAISTFVEFNFSSITCLRMVSAALHASFRVMDCKQVQTRGMWHCCAEDVLTNYLTTAASLHNATIILADFLLSQRQTMASYLRADQVDLYTLLKHPFEQCFPNASTVACMTFETEPHILSPSFKCLLFNDPRSEKEESSR